MKGITNGGPRKLSAAAASLAIFAAAILPAETAPAALSVDDAVAAALRNNLAVKSAITQNRIAKSESDFSFNKFFPTVSAQATALKMNKVSPVFVGVTSASEGIYVTPEKENASLNLTVQEVFSPAFFALMQSATLDYKQSSVGKARAEREIAAATKKYYYQLIVQTEAIALTNARLDNANEQLRQAKVAYDLGQGTELNYRYAKASVDSLIPELRAMETERRIALTRFQELIGFEKRADMALKGSLDDEKIDGDSGRAAEGTRLDVAEANLSIRQLKAALAAQDLNLFPNLVFQYTADPSINGPKADTIGDRDNWSQSTGAASVTLAWTLSSFLPGSDYWVKRGAIRDRLSLAKESAETAARNAIHDEENQRELIRDSLAKIANLTDAVEDTKRTWELTDASYRAGAGRYLDAQSAELAWRGAEMQLLGERLNLISLKCDFGAKYGNVD